MIRIRVLEAASVIERRIGLEAAVGLQDQRVLQRIVAAAIVVGAELRSERVHEGSAGFKGGGAGGAKGGGDGREGVLGLEEG